MKYLTDIRAVIALLVVLFGAASTLAYGAYELKGKLDTGLVQLASLSDEIRKMRIHDEKEDVEDRIWWLESHYGPEAGEGNEGNQTEYKDLKIKFDCLRAVRHDKDKTYKDCDTQ